MTHIEAIENLLAEYDMTNSSFAKALRQAIEQAEQPAQHDIPDLIAGALGVSRGTAYDLMREALTEQAQPLEQFCWQSPEGTVYQASDDEIIPGSRPVYLTTAPPRQPWVGLTDEEIWKFWWSRPEVPDGEDDSMEAEFVAAVRRILAAHGIKGEA